MERLLIDNAYESWKNTLKYHSKILNGYFSLENKKGFVASLHNSVELFLKQIMLDDNNHDVLNGIGENNREKLKQMFDNATDLNSFFAEHSTDEFYTIKFKNLIKISPKLLVAPIEQERIIKKDLELLNRLRNNETHFYIDEVKYLNEKEFTRLWRFMGVFYGLIVKKNMMPFKTFNVLGEQLIFHDVSFSVQVDDRINNFNYLTALKSNVDYKNVISLLRKSQNFIGDPSISDIENLLNEIWRFEKDSKILDRYYTVILLMKKYNMLKIYRNNLKTVYNANNCDYEFEQSYRLELLV